MKKILSYIISQIISLFWNLYPHSLAKKLSFRIDQLYTFWIAREFKSIGKNIYFSRPIYLKGGKYIIIGEGFSSLARLRLECWDKFGTENFTPKMTIGNNVIMNFNVHIGCINNVTIGNHVLFASNIFITDHSHGYSDERHMDIPPEFRPLVSKGPVIINDYCWIGENVSILPNVTIGKGCIIGANSVVTKSFPEYSVIAGVPAKLIKTINIK